MKDKSHESDDGILLGCLVQRQDPVKDGEPEPSPTEEAVNGLVLLHAQLEEKDDPDNHSPDKYPE